MKKPFIQYCLIFMTAALLPTTGYTQFVTLHPGVTIATVEDIEMGDGQKAIFATDNGILIYDKAALTWKHINASAGLSELHTKALEPYPGGFLYSAINGKRGSCNYSTVTEQSSINYISAICIDPVTGDTLTGGTNHQFYVNRAGTSYSIDPAGFFGITFGSIVDINKVSITGGGPNVFIVTSDDKAVIFDLASVGGYPISVATAPGLVSDNMTCNVTNGYHSYIGTDQGVTWTDLADWPSPTIHTIDKTNSPLPSDTITALAVRDTDLYIGTDKGLTIRVKGIWHTYTTTSSNLPSNNIAELAIKDSILYVGSKDGKICMFGSNIPTSVCQLDMAQECNIFPNPANGELNITGVQATTVYQLYDVTGVIRMQGVLNQGDNVLHIKDLAHGLYIFDMLHGDIHNRIKVVKN